jgi:hypothetical protein
LQKCKTKKSCGYAVADLQNWAFTLEKISGRFEFEFLGILFMYYSGNEGPGSISRQEVLLFGCSGSEVSHFRN